MSEHRTLAIDYGERRVGMALSDPTGTIAGRYRTLDRRTLTRPLEEEAAALCVTLGVTEVILGYPRNMDGSTGKAARAVEAFHRRLQARLQIPIILWDERLTTQRAQRMVREIGGRRRRRKERLDMVSAEVLLQRYLDARVLQTTKDSEI